MTFTSEEIATIRKFLFWVRDIWIDPDCEGVTGFNDDGFLITEFRAESGYEGSVELERETKEIPLLAMTDPDEYERQEAAREEAIRLRNEDARRLYDLARQQAERAQYEALKRKFEGPKA